MANIKLRIAVREYSDFENALTEEIELYRKQRPDVEFEAVPLDLHKLHAALFTDASPGPTKYALSRIRDGFPAGLRLPMTLPSAESRRAVDAALEHAGLA